MRKRGFGGKVLSNTHRNLLFQVGISQVVRAIAIVIELMADDAHPTTRLFV